MQKMPQEIRQLSKPWQEAQRVKNVQDQSQRYN